MNFLRKLAGLFTGSRGGGSSRQFKIYVLSRRCNEPIEGEVDLYNELSQAEDESAHGYFTRKVLHTTGENRCFDQVEVSIWFDNNKNLSEHQVEGGRWLTQEEYEKEVARFYAPPQKDDQVDDQQDDRSNAQGEDGMTSAGASAEETAPIGSPTANVSPDPDPEQPSNPDKPS